MPENETETRRVALDFDPGPCNGCQGCLAVAPEHVSWNDDLEQPEFDCELLDEETARELQSICREDCFLIRGEEKDK